MRVNTKLNVMWASIESLDVCLICSQLVYVEDSLLTYLEFASFSCGSFINNFGFDLAVVVL